MILTDSIYGQFTVEPIIKKLINTSTVQRLKNIHQGGASYLVNPKWNVTRYEHSIGTMLFIKLMGGSLEEQIAGLLHDISHTAFSHVIDFALENSNEDYHEIIYSKVVEESEIPRILKEYGYNYKDILEDESKWTILEQSAPSLCADRIDYTLRDMYHYGYITRNEINDFLSYLKVIDGEIMITSIDKAEWFVSTYYKEVIEFFMHPLNVYAYDRLSKALKLGLTLKTISFEDLLKDDFEVYTLLKSSKYNEILSLIDSLNYDIKVIEKEHSFDIHQVNKLRLIDPKVFINNSIINASKISNLIVEMNASALSKSLKGTYIKIIN
ncbi:MAG: HD domain-containing protein [Clostridium sp.]